MPTKQQRDKAKALPMNEVISLYEQGKSARKIASIYGVSKSTIQKRLKDRGLTRPLAEVNFFRYHGFGHSPPTNDEIKELYVNKQMQTQEIASRCGISATSVRDRLAKLGLLRSKSEAIKLAFQQGKIRRPSGAEHYKWKGGMEKRHGYVYIYTGKGLRKRRSQIVWEETHGQTLPKGWVIHHINGIKDDDRPENLVAMPKRRHDRISLGIDLVAELRKRIRALETEIKELKERGIDVHGKVSTLRKR